MVTRISRITVLIIHPLLIYFSNFVTCHKKFNLRGTYSNLQEGLRLICCQLRLCLSLLGLEFSQLWLCLSLLELELCQLRLCLCTLNLELLLTVTTLVVLTNAFYRMMFQICGYVEMFHSIYKQVDTTLYTYNLYCF